MNKLTDRYIMGLVDNLENLKGQLSSPDNITGHLNNALLRGMPVELQIDGTILQWKYEDESSWTDLINLNELDYELLGNLPTLNGVNLIGELAEMFMLPGDEITTQELNAILND